MYYCSHTDIIVIMCSSAMIPLWLFTLGTTFEDDKISLNVPFGKIVMTLCVIIIPLFIGAAIKRWLPRVAKVRTQPFGIILYCCHGIASNTNAEDGDFGVGWGGGAACVRACV